MTTPAGNPSWTRSAASSTYGGHQNKQNYQQQGVTNPLTDIGADEFIRTTLDLSAAVSTAAFAIISLTCNDGTPAAPTINWVRAQNATALSPYAGDSAATGLPSGSRNSAGNVTLQWEASLTDEYGASAAPAIIGAEARVNGYDATVTLDDNRTITVEALNSGTPIADATITVWVY